MRYFIVNLAAHLIVTIALVVLTCVFAGRNKRRKTRYMPMYFLPILLALLAIIDIIVITAPRMMDINSMINDNFYLDSGEVEDIGFMKNYFVIDGKHYYMNPLRNKMNEGDVVKVKHTPYSSFTVDITMVKDAEGEENVDDTTEETN